MTEAWLFVLQRTSALVLLPLVIVHTVLLLGILQGGMSASDVLLRTRGSLGWALFYGLFALAAAVHAPIGLRTVLREWTSWRGRSLDLAMAALGILLLGLGMWAVLAILR